MRKYIPLWTDRYPDPQQHYDLGWIYASTKDEPKYSLLPLRYYGRGWVYRDNFHQSFVVNKFYPEMTGQHWLILRIIPARYCFAEALYKAAAKCVFEKYPQIENITFGEQTADGVYPCIWGVPYDTLLAEIEYQIKYLYDNGFTVDEKIEISELREEDSDKTVVEISGVIEGEIYEIEDRFPNCHPDNYTKQDLKKGIRFSLEECYKLYRIFTEDELCLGNQSRIFEENEKRYAEEFAVVDRHDFEALKKLAESGFDLNTMGRWGETAFSRYIPTCRNFKQLDRLIELGANPALFGCEFDAVECPLWNACMDGDVALVKYLLEKGINPIINTDTHNEWGEFLIDRMDRWADEAREDFQGKYRKIYHLLNEYCDT